MMARARGGRALGVVATLLVAAAMVAGYARAELADSERFSTRAASALEDDAVREALATGVVDRLARSVSPDVLAVRPLLVAGVRALAGTPQFRQAVARALGAAHARLVDGSGSYVVAIDASGPVVGGALRALAPRAARALPADLRVEIVTVAPNDAVLEGARGLDELAGWSWILLVAAVLACAGIALVTRDARRAAASVAAAVAVAGAIVAALVTLLGAAVTGTDDALREDARRAVWSALAGDLRASGLVVALAGTAVVALVAAGDPFAAAADRARALARSASLPARVARAALLAALGLGVIVAPEATLDIAVTLAGAALVLLAVGQLRPRDRPGASPADRPRGPLRPLLAVIAVIAVAVLVTATVILPAPKPDAVARAGPAGGCNGDAALCGRRLNEVAFPATHNSYAAAEEPGWLFANQRHGIERQLRDGIRAFLIDVHLGVPDPRKNRVRTDLAAEGGSRNKVVRELSPRALRVADRVAGRVGATLEGRRRPYLCHTLCELGAEPLEQELATVAAFLEANPGEVVILFVEPYTSVEVFERGLRATGLLSQAAPLARDAPLPTLGDLVRDGTRLVVLAEEDGGARPWYLPGFSFAQDTPLGMPLSCAAARGSADSPLFVVNHWDFAFPPRPSNNDRIAGDALRDRLRRCERQRGLLPNLIAVDFYERSGVVRAARELNGIGP